MSERFDGFQQRRRADGTSDLDEFELRNGFQYDGRTALVFRA